MLTVFKVMHTNVALKHKAVYSDHFVCVAVSIIHTLAI